MESNTENVPVYIAIDIGGRYDEELRIVTSEMYDFEGWLSKVRNYASYLNIETNSFTQRVSATFDVLSETYLKTLVGDGGNVVWENESLGIAKTEVVHIPQPLSKSKNYNAWRKTVTNMTRDGSTTANHMTRYKVSGDRVVTVAYCNLTMVDIQKIIKEFEGIEIDTFNLFGERVLALVLRQVRSQ